MTVPPKPRALDARITDLARATPAAVRTGLLPGEPGAGTRLEARDGRLEMMAY